MILNHTYHRADEPTKDRNHSGIRRFLLIIIVAMTVTGALSAGFYRLMREPLLPAMAQIALEPYHVTPGDSLWSIAEQHGVHSLRTEEVVAWIRAHNKLNTSLLSVGQLLEVPATH